MSLLSRLRRILFPPRSLALQHDRSHPDAWLTIRVPAGTWTPPRSPDEPVIARQLRATERLGKQPLWEGYQQLENYRRTDRTRTAKEVSTFGPLGHFFTWLVASRKPSLIVEIGTAFGASGMYWLSGIRQAGGGHLLTFEPNTLWSEQARRNLESIDPRFTLVQGTFEEKAAEHLQGKTVDMALIDAIHTSAFVCGEFNTIAPHLAPHALVLVDDIDFSDDMRQCWKTLVQDTRVKAAVNVGRLGILEMQ